MKPTLLFTTLSLALLSPVAFAKSELELLRDRCAEQERQIRLLEDENLKLRSLGERARPGNTTPVSVPTPAAPSAPAASPAPSAPATYTIKQGDNLGKIARNHGTTPEAIIRLNGIKDPLKIQPGQKIKIPGTSSSSSPAPSTSAGKTHRVASGETFYSIAKKHRISVEALIAANPKVNPATLRPGQVINLTKASTAPQPVSAPKTAPAPALAPATGGLIPVSTADPKPAPLSPTPQPEKNPVEKPVIRLVKIDGVTTYGEFAKLHQTNVGRLNELNDLDLSSSTVLAIGSELYVPAQP
jgi:LysM repeat protein